MIEICKKEYKQFFVSPRGYVIVAIYFFISSLYFCTVNLSNVLVELSYDFAFQSNWLLMFLLPMLTMRLLAEERKTKTDQLLLTSPVSVTGIVYGKFFGALIVYLICISCNALFFAIVSTHSTIFLWREFVCRMIGMILLGGAIISVDMFISALTESQLLAAFVAMGVNILMLITRSYVATISSPVLQFLAGLLSVFGRFYDTFAMGIFSISNAVYYISFTVFFLFVTIQIIEKRRWG